MRICKDCKIEKSLFEFHRMGLSKVTQEMRYRWRCKKCHNTKFAPPTGKPNTGRFQKGHISTHGFKKGHATWNKGMAFYPEALKNASDAIRGTGVTRNSYKALEWRKSVWKRDSYECQECFSKEDICAHHIQSFIDYPELRFDIDNGLTLCRACHSFLHGKINCCVKNGNKFKKGQVPWNKGLVSII